MIPILNHIQPPYDLNFGSDVEFCYFSWLIFSWLGHMIQIQVDICRASQLTFQWTWVRPSDRKSKSSIAKSTVTYDQMLEIVQSDE